MLDKGGYYPLTYSMSADKLSEQLKLCNVDCNVNGHLINHIMYADDSIFKLNTSHQHRIHVMHQ